MLVGQNHIINTSAIRHILSDMWRVDNDNNKLVSKLWQQFTTGQKIVKFGATLAAKLFNVIAENHGRKHLDYVHGCW